MEREQKFRAWDKINKKMVYFKFGDLDDGFIGTLEVDNKGYGGKVAPVMQYTGLKDKNGKEIYEWDIIRGKYLALGAGKETFTSVVEINTIYPYIHIGAHYQEDEVIGNIYENPKLKEEIK